MLFISDPREPPGPLGLLHTSSTRFNQDRSLESPGKLTTWSNLSKSPSGFQQSPPQPVIWQSRNREELNNNSASDAAENYDRYEPFLDSEGGIGVTIRESVNITEPLFSNLVTKKMA